MANEWIKRYVVQEAFLNPSGTAEHYSPPPRENYDFVPESPSSGLSNGVKVAGMLSLFAATAAAVAAVAISQSKRDDEKR